MELLIFYGEDVLILSTGRLEAALPFQGSWAKAGPFDYAQGSYEDRIGVLR